MNLWTDFKAMLKDIKASEFKVDQDDLPLENILGYKSITSDVNWRIKTSDIKMNFGDATVDATGLFNIISTETGKQKLLETLNEGK